MEIIGYIHTDFPQKFGIPRQSGLVRSRGRIQMVPPYNDPEAVKGLADFDYIWLLWEFQVPEGRGFNATVKPPRLGGNTHMGVFATRSPFRPNRIGLSCVRLVGIEYTDHGPEIVVEGADLRDKTPIYDIKPYLPYADAHPDARAGWTDHVERRQLQVIFPEEELIKLPEDKRQAAVELLSEDPRPSYQDDPERRYGAAFAGMDIRFTVNDDVLTVVEVVPFKAPSEKKK